jgi:hypothetical protein
VFLDETWVYANDSESRMWIVGTVKSVKKIKPTASDTRYIILHAGTQNGFVSGTSLTLYQVQS